MQMKKLLTLLLALMLCSFAAAEEAPVLEVHQMALGFADGYLIRLGDVEIVVDGGNPEPMKPTDDVLRYLRAAGVDALDAYIATHWHLDHCMNMNLILDEFGDAQTQVYGVTEKVPESIFNGTVTAPFGGPVKGVYQQMKMGDVLTFGGMTLTCIGPRQIARKGEANVDSLNFVLEYGTRKFLFTGDFAQSGCINNEYRELCANVDVLKFPHHGHEPYEVGNKAMKVLRPQYILVPGVAYQYKLWNDYDNIGVKFPKENIFTNAEGHVVILTDGGERFDVLIQQKPEDYAPKTN